MVRLFVAVYPPPEAAAAMLAQLRLHTLADHRETPAEQIHLTLAFLGDTRLSDLEAVTESVGRAASGLAAITLIPTRLVTMPGRGVPRLVACETDRPGPLLELHKRLVSRLLTPRERSEFTPHLTLARFKPYAKPASLELTCTARPFVVDKVRLMKSDLRPEGARHVEVAAFELSG